MIRNFNAWKCVVFFLILFRPYNCKKNKTNQKKSKNVFFFCFFCLENKSFLFLGTELMSVMFTCKINDCVSGFGLEDALSTKEQNIFSKNQI